jgi:hypothetical protein
MHLCVTDMAHLRFIFSRCSHSFAELWSCLIGSACALPTSIAEAWNGDQTSLIAEQGRFFVGGRDVKSDALSTIPAFASEGSNSVDRALPDTGTPAALFDTSLTGKTWETTPDGRIGWNEYSFASVSLFTYLINDGEAARRPDYLGQRGQGEEGAFR